MIKRFTLISCLFLSQTLFASEEKVILIRDKNLDPVNILLSQGWKVKHQSVSVSISSSNPYDRNGKEESIILFTLTKETESFPTIKK